MKGKINRYYNKMPGQLHLILEPYGAKNAVA